MSEDKESPIIKISDFSLFSNTISKNFLSGLLYPISFEIKILEKYFKKSAFSNLSYCCSLGRF